MLVTLMIPAACLDNFAVDGEYTVDFTPAIDPVLWSPELNHVWLGDVDITDELSFEQETAVQSAAARYQLQLEREY